MAYVEHISGFEKVMSELRSQLKGIELRSAKGLIEVAVLLRNETEKIPPVTPVDLGNLRASWFAIVTDKRVSDNQGRSGKFRDGTKASPRPEGFGARLKREYEEALAEYSAVVLSNKPNFCLITGYSAFYAAAVHENIGMHNPANPYWSNRKWREGSGPKWFQAAIERNKNKIVTILGNNAKIKGGGV